MVHELTKKNSGDLVERAQLPVVIDVSAPWCGPCVQMKPIFEQLSEELGGSYSFLGLNVDEERDIAIQYSVTSIPTFLFFKEGKLVGREMGYMAKDKLHAKIKEYLG